ncbi:MAG: hypothetical protein AAF433_04315 [Bacteroidota bacterium]
MIRLFTSLTLVLIVSFSLRSQDIPELIMGEISAADQAMTTYPEHPDAPAVVLHKKISLELARSRQGLLLSQVHHRRIKLFMATAFELANVEISYLTGAEEVRELEALMILPSGEEIIIHNRNFNWQEGDGISKVSFSFPQVTEGVILEYRYRKLNRQLTVLPSMYFQEKIPVRHAEYLAQIHPYYHFEAASNAFNEMCISRSQRIINDQNQVTRVDHHYAMCNLAPLKIEPLVNNMTDYTPHVHLQLNKYIVLGSGWVDANNSWEQLAESFWDNPNLGKRLTKARQLRGIFSSLEPISGDNETARARHILQQIDERLEWNGSYYLGSSIPLQEVWENTVGNATQLNLILLAILRENGIQAEPLLVGLRGRGNPIKDYPIFNQFSHLMVLTQLDGKEKVIDVNGSNSIIGLPRVQALNGAAWVASLEHPRWIDLVPPASQYWVETTMSLAADGQADTELHGLLSGYFRSNYETELATGPATQPLFAELQAKFPEAQFEAEVAETKTVPDEELIVSLVANCQIAELSGDLLYLRPTLLDLVDFDLPENPQRQLPIDFAFPFTVRYQANILLPDNYELEELPEPQVIENRSQRWGVQLDCSYQKSSHSLTFNYNFQLEKARLDPQQYRSLRDFLQRAMSFQETVVVLRKQ